MDKKDEIEVIQRESLKVYKKPEVIKLGKIQVYTLGGSGGSPDSGGGLPLQTL